ncbi:MAG: DRTGG domain-containing protein [Dehalococcoidia bacterium]
MEEANDAITVGSIAQCINGELLNSPGKMDEVIESFMVGAMCVDPSPLYFGIKSNKAVITRGDRPDIQLGALETSTKCIVVTGGTKPVPGVLQHAERQEIPMLLIEKDTLTTLKQLEDGLGRLVKVEPDLPGETIEAGDKPSPEVAAGE